MKIKKSGIYGFALLILVVVSMIPPGVAQNFGQGFSTTSSFSSSTSYSSVTRQVRPTFETYYGGDVATYWPVLGSRETCDARSDLLLSVAPAGCSPVVVRSDLLAEQNVPVFCQIDSYKVNPLVDVSQVRNIRFIGEYPEEVAGVGFHPARAALRSQDRLLGAPLLNNIGYAVVVLKRQPDESKLPDNVNVTLSAQIEYNAGNSLGVGSSEFILREMSDAEWENEKFKQSFWNGRYFVRLEEVDSNFATVSIYDGDVRYVTQRIERGQTAREIYVPGVFCQAGLQISYDGFVTAGKTARIEVTSDGAADVFEVTEGSYFFNNKCRVSSIDVNPDRETGRVIAYCNGKNIELVLRNSLGNSTGQFVSVDGVSVAPRVVNGNEYEIDLSEHPDESKRGKYILDSSGYLLKSSSDGSYSQYVSPQGNFVFNSGSFSESERVWYVQLWTRMISLRGGGVSGSVNTTSEAYRYFQEAIEEFESVAEDYPLEKRNDLEGTPTFGEAALKEAIQLAREFGAGDVERRLIDTYRQTYPDSVESSIYLSRLNDLGRLDYSKAGESVDFDDKTRVVRLLSVSEPVDKPSAELRVNGQRFDIDYRERKAIPEGFVNGTSLGEIVLDVLEPDRVRLSAYCRNENGIISTRREIYELGVGGTTRDICGVDVSFVSATTKEVAKLRINPIARGTETLTNLTINIGIEKRDFEITPEKAREKIENLNESIKEWEDASEKLGNVVSGLKTACFATSAVLTFKNFATGLSGESLARQKVMNGENGWRARCSEKVAAGEYPTMDACYLANSGEIDSEVSASVNALNKVNTQIQNIQSKHLNDPQGIANIFGQSVDADATRLELAAYARQEYGSTTINLTKLKDGREWIGADGQKKDRITVAEILSEENIKSGVVSTDAIREIMLGAEMKKSGVSGEHLENVESNLGVVADRINEGRVISGELAKDNVLRSEGFASPLILGASGQEQRVMNVRSVSGNQIGNINFGDLKYTATAVVPASASQKEGGPSFNAGTYILGLREADIRGGTYVVEKVWDKQTGQPVENVAEFSQVYGIGSVKAADRTSLNNEINNADRTCHFYETEPYRGMPAVIPFDVKAGWYAATRQTLPVFGGIGAFDASGRVSSFWLCNVGENGRVEFNSGLGDDLCQQINLNTGQPLGNFPGLSESEARARINQAVRAIEDAARQYPNKFITINGERCEVGKPAVDTPGTQCQDFMSPQDCNLMFNVCDPVVCPSSRCDFGGTYPVANVAQTGIVGSTLLCLPNVREGIVIPVCLTGIKAGLDGWISIMRNYRDCLQENIETGQTVGICDQIHSIYLCEFFWGQVAPFVNVLIPKLIEVAYGQGVRGGGEYLTVQAAWQNMQNSVDYFTQSYAVNSLNAFQTRTEGQYGNYLTSTASIGELGTELCQGFISAKAPKAFEALVESDSPPQFHAWFDEKTFTTATVPATSQYKVFYHIFAGNDAGVQFSVYLKNPPESSFYATNPYVQIASGFVPRGEYASQTWDGTAPAGYKELCVRINNEEECGFGQVSTSFAVNYLRDAYISDELKRTNIQSEQECVSGSNSPGALLNPNLQAGVEEFASPTIYNRGVVRVCATENPGKGTNPERFINVGNCGDPKIGCWLDERSVDRALTRNNVGVKNDTLEALQDRTREYLENSGEVYNEAEANEKLDELEKRVLSLAGGTQSRSEKIAIARDLIFESDLHMEKLFFNSHKARLHLIRGQLYSVIARSLKVEEDSLIQNSRPSVPGISGVPSSSGSSSVPGSFANCRVSNPRWTTPSGVSIEEAEEGDEVWMVADASAECEDEVFEFRLVEKDYVLQDVEIPLELADEQFVENGVLYYNWIVEYDESLSGILEGALDYEFEVRASDFSVTSGFSNTLKVREPVFIGPEEESGGSGGAEQPGELPEEISSSEEYKLRFVEGNIWRVYLGDSATEIFVNGQTRAFYFGRPPEGVLVGFANEAGRIVINNPQDEHSASLDGTFYSELEVVESSASSQPSGGQPSAQLAAGITSVSEEFISAVDNEKNYRLYYQMQPMNIYFDKPNWFSGMFGDNGDVEVAVLSDERNSLSAGQLAYVGRHFGSDELDNIQITNFEDFSTETRGTGRYKISESDYSLLEFLRNNPVALMDLLARHGTFPARPDNVVYPTNQEGAYVENMWVSDMSADYYWLNYRPRFMENEETGIRFQKSTGDVKVIVRNSNPVTLPGGLVFSSGDLVKVGSWDGGKIEITVRPFFVDGVPEALSIYSFKVKGESSEGTFEIDERDYRMLKFFSESDVSFEELSRVPIR